VKRHAAANAATTQYDVFNADGTFQEAVALPANATVVGFGKGVVFISVRNGAEGAFILHALARP
jgi:hypothetical protein